MKFIKIEHCSIRWYWLLALLCYIIFINYYIIISEVYNSSYENELKFKMNKNELKLRYSVYFIKTDRA